MKRDTMLINSPHHITKPYTNWINQVATRVLLCYNIVTTSYVFRGVGCTFRVCYRALYP